MQGSAGLHCGPFQLTQAYWIDAGRPGHSSGVSFEQCANNRACAEQTVFNYIDRFANDCDHDGQLTCNDFAILHRTGRSSCHLDRIRSTTFWQNFAHSKCFASKLPIVRNGLMWFSLSSYRTVDCMFRDGETFLFLFQIILFQCVDVCAMDKKKVYATKRLINLSMSFVSLSIS